jgi:peptidoglycan DL-endopeptidase CwlO
MRRWITGGTVALVVLLGLAVVLFGAALTPTPAAAQDQDCQATLGPWPTDGGDGAADAAHLSVESREIVGQIIGIGKGRGLPPRAWQVAIQAGMTESGLRNLPYGDRDSLGIFQMRPSMGWGTPAELQDIPYQINKFYDTLLTVPGWEELRPGDAAQRVERSAFPDRYHRWEAMAAHLVATLGEVTDPTGCGTGASGEAAARAIEAAKRWLGTPYAWGGGGIDGPTAGEGGAVGFDCSGLMLHAYHQAGITLPRVSWQQYTAGQHVPLAAAQPGDLLFWAHDPSNPASIHHVALYLGNNEVIHAPQRNDVVKISTVWQQGLVDTVTRPGQ